MLRTTPATLLLLMLAPLCAANEPPARVPWTTSKFTGTPEPPLPFVTQRVYDKITFTNPLEVAPLPGTDRLIIAEQRGRLYTFSTKKAESPDLLIDVRKWNDEARECYSFALHPKFSENRFIYLWINLDGKGKPNRDDGTRIVRFTLPIAKEGAAPSIDLASAKPIITFMSGGHNGGALRFGPDGMLYISIGDGEVPDPPDPRNTGQDISDLAASILRIDVDGAAENEGYRIPQGNPFAKMKGARGEVWAYGFRNPWRFSFDPSTGDLFAGDVGWELWEAVFRVKRGGNYGWSLTEMSRQPVKPEGRPGPTPVLSPVAAHSHEEAMSITGGETYSPRGPLTDLRGTHIYGDWETGRIWGFTPKRDAIAQHRELCDSTLKIISFGHDADGELLIVDYVGGGLHKLVVNPKRAEAQASDVFPRKLSASGLFMDVTKHEPADGVLEYGVRAPRWADGATGQRLLALPGLAKVTKAPKEDGILPAGRWVLPKDGVLAKTYSLEMETGKPESAQRIETQVMHWNGQTWSAYSYRWNDAQTDAELVPAGGDERELTVIDADAPGRKRLQTWRFHSRVECQRCHNAWVNYMPGFNKLQLESRPHGPKGSENPLQGYIDDPLAEPRPTMLIGSLPKPLLVDSRDESKHLMERARSYLHANCGACHRFGGGGAVPMFLNIETKLDGLRLIDAKPTQGDFGLTDARLIAPGAPARSVVLFRMATTGRGHMPYVGSREVDDGGLKLVAEWIRSLKPDGDGQQSSLRHEVQLHRLVSGDTTRIDRLLDTPSGALAAAIAIAEGTLTGKARDELVDRGANHADPLRRDLFQRFLPDGKRRVLLGDKIDAPALLAMPGDTARGSSIFTSTAQCNTCHRIGGEGTSFGPDLSKIGAKHKRADLLDHIVSPSRSVEEAWKLVLIETTDGATHTGFIAARDAATLTLTVAGGKQVAIKTSDIAEERKQNLSAMPDGLLRSLTAQEAADLLAFLASLK